MTWQLFILTDGKPVKNCWNGEMCSDLANIYLANSISFHDRINLNSVAQRTGLKQSSGISVFSTLPFHPSRPRNMKWKTEAAKFVGSDTIFNRSEIHHGKVTANWLQRKFPHSSSGIRPYELGPCQKVLSRKHHDGPYPVEHLNTCLTLSGWKFLPEEKYFHSWSSAHAHDFIMKYHMKRTSSPVKTQIWGCIFGHSFVVS